MTSTLFPRHGLECLSEAAIDDALGQLGRPPLLVAMLAYQRERRATASASLALLNMLGAAALQPAPLVSAALGSTDRPQAVAPTAASPLAGPRRVPSRE